MKRWNFLYFWRPPFWRIQLIVLFEKDIFGRSVSFAFFFLLLVHNLPLKYVRRWWMGFEPWISACWQMGTITLPTCQPLCRLKRLEKTYVIGLLLALYSSQLSGNNVDLNLSLVHLTSGSGQSTTFCWLRWGSMNIGGPHWMPLGCSIKDLKTPFHF